MNDLNYIIYKIHVLANVFANKNMVLTLPARDSFRIHVRHKRLGGGIGFVLPVKARAGRTCEAFGCLFSILTSLLQNVPKKFGVDFLLILDEFS